MNASQEVSTIALRGVLCHSALSRVGTVGGLESKHIESALPWSAEQRCWRLGGWFSPSWLADAHLDHVKRANDDCDMTIRDIGRQKQRGDPLAHRQRSRPMLHADPTARTRHCC
jgi:hypothetical protein